MQRRALSTSESEASNVSARSEDAVRRLRSASENEGLIPDGTTRASEDEYGKLVYSLLDLCYSVVTGEGLKNFNDQALRK